MCVRVWKEEVAEGFDWTGGMGRWAMGAGGRWYTLVPVSPLIKSSLKELGSEHAHTQYLHKLTFFA